MVIKLILISCLLFLAWLMFRGPGSTTQVAWRRISVVLVAAAGMVTVAFPDILTWVAQLVGVGRGTDLLLYGYVVFSLFLIIGLYQRTTRLEQRMTRMVRDVALRTASGDHGRGPAEAHAPASDRDAPAT